MRCLCVFAVAFAALSFMVSPAGAAGFNGKIAVQINFPGRILTVNPDGTGLRYLTNSTSSNSSPAWAPGGRRLAFVSLRDGNYEIYVMNADGTGQTRLTFYDSYDLDPTFSPDGSKIMFTRLTDTGTHLYVMNANGLDQHQIGTLRGQWPAWSPDGAKIAYEWLGDIWVADADGTDAVNLTNSEGGEAFPRWTPDGTGIVFRTAGGVEVVSVAGGAPAQFTFRGNPFNSLPVFSPDGTEIAFESNREALVAHADGTFTDLFDNLCCPLAIAWQPLWVRFGPPPPREITYGQSAPTTVQLSLRDTTENDTVSIYERRAGVDTLVAASPVDANGEAVFELTPERNTTYVAKWEGDATHTGSTTDAAVVNVHALVRTRLAGAYGISGNYKLYHAGDGVRQTATVVPNHAGKVVHFETQRLTATGKWVYVASIGLKLGSNSSVTAVFRTDRPGRYRAFTEFGGDSDHLRGRSQWAYFKITR